ncbi:hypothetical protein P692DRAFT_20782591, partial [Suillus brevipes Sb2]
MPPGKTSATTSTGPPKTHSPTPTNAPNTRRTTRNPIPTDDILALPNDVMDTTDAEKFLTSKLLCLEDQPFTAAHLSSILFHITQMSSATPTPVIAAIRAVAFLLRKQVVCEIAEAAANTLATSLTDTISSRLVDHAIAALAPQIANIHVASEALSKTAQQADTTLATTLDKAERGVSVAAERIEEVADALYATVSDCQNAVKLLAPSLDSTQERLNLLSKQMLTSPPSTHPAPSLSYSAATAAHLPLKVDHAIGRAAIRACQIILDPKPGTSLFPPGTSNKDMA